MINNVIDILKTRLSLSGLVSQSYGLCELVTDAKGQTSPKEYCGSDQWNDISDYGNYAGVSYWRKSGDITMSESTGNVACDRFIDFTIPLYLVLVIRKSVMNDNQYTPDSIATTIIRDLIGNSATLKSAVGARRASVSVTGYDTDAESVMAREYNAVDAARIRTDYAHISLNVSVTISIKSDCIPNDCSPSDSCERLLASLTNSELLDCILPSYDFADTTTLDHLTAQQELDLQTALCDVATVEINGTTYGTIPSGATEDIPVENSVGTPLGVVTPGVSVVISDITKTDTDGTVSAVPAGVNVTCTQLTSYDFTDETDVSLLSAQQKSDLGIVSSPADLTDLSLWMDANDTTTINAKLAAQFTAANNEYLSSNNAVFKVGDEDFSFGGWYYPTVSSATSMGTMGVYNSTGNNRAFLLVLRNYEFQIVISSNGSSITTTSYTGVIPVINTWYFAVFVYDSVNNLVRVSVNGNTFHSIAHSGGAYASSTASFNLNNYSSIYGSCRIDSAFFYKKALTQAQVTALYNSGNGVAYENLTADQLTNLTAWWSLNERSGNRADEHGGYTLTDNNTVTYALGKVQEPIEPDEYVWSWVDKSDNAFVFSQDTAASQPQWKASGFGTNSMPYISFDGVDDFLSYVGANALSCLKKGTVFIVYSSSDTSAIQHILTSADTASGTKYISFRTLAIGSDNYIAVAWQNGGTENIIHGDDFTNANDTEVMYSLKSTGVSNAYELRRNEVTQANTAVSGSDYGAMVGDVDNRDNMVVGALIRNSSTYSSIRIAEIIITSTVLTNTNIAMIQDYLTNKYGSF